MTIPSTTLFLLLVVVVLVLFSRPGYVVNAFTVTKQCNVHGKSIPTRTTRGGGVRTSLYDMVEWREAELWSPSSTSSASSSSISSSSLVRELPILLADANDVVLQGEMKYFHLNHDDEVRLFQQTVDKNHGIFGLAYTEPPIFNIDNDIDDDDDDSHDVHDNYNNEDDDEEEQYYDDDDDILIVRDVQQLENDDDDEEATTSATSETTTLCDKMVLMEIQDYNIMDINLGIFCSAKVVGKATILEQLSSSSSSNDENGTCEEQQQQPRYPISVLCTENFDRTEENVNLQEANELGNEIVSLISTISAAEKEKEERQRSAAVAMQSSSSSIIIMSLPVQIIDMTAPDPSSSTTFHENDDDDDGEVVFNENGNEHDMANSNGCDENVNQRGDVGRDHDDDEDVDNTVTTRLERFWTAYRRALDSDSLGYIVSDEVEAEAGEEGQNTSSSIHTRSWKELNAISWAAYSSSEKLQTDSTYRIAALDNDLMTNRLRLAIYWLRDTLEELLREEEEEPTIPIITIQ